MDIEISSQFQQVIDLIQNSDKNLFLTGKAGTGKSTLLSLIRYTTTKQLAVLAPTGLAAINVEGQTIHSFFRFPPGITPLEAADEGRKRRRDEVFKKLQLIIIDEISMVRSDLLDAMDIFLQNIKNSPLPFGGVQTIMIGDLYQLPPILRSDELMAHSEHYETPYFFSAYVIKNLQNSFGNLLEFIELEKIYRQTDQEFIDLLNAVRLQQINYQSLEKLNQRYDPAWQNLADDHVILTATNRRSEDINQQNLNKLKTEEGVYEGKVTGKFAEKDYPTLLELPLKLEARVMLIKNDPKARWVNGTLGTVKAMLNHSVIVELDNGKEVEVEDVKWEVFKTVVNEETGEFEKQVLGSFEQLPLKLAWSITIHKSQGQTFDKLILDLERGAFTTGQTYVALSRCRTLEGLVLANKLKLTDIKTDQRVNKFLMGLKK